MMKLATVADLELARDFAAELADVMCSTIRVNLAPNVDRMREASAMREKLTPNVDRMHAASAPNMDRVRKAASIFGKVEETILLARTNLRMQLNGRHVTALEALGQAHLDFTQIMFCVSSPSQITQRLWDFAGQFDLQLMLGNVRNEIALAILYVKEEAERDRTSESNDESGSRKNQPKQPKGRRQYKDRTWEVNKYMAAIESGWNGTVPEFVDAVLAKARDRKYTEQDRKAVIERLGKVNAGEITTRRRE